MPQDFNLDLTDWQSPEAREARSAAIDLIAARIGGAAYPSEFASRFGGARPVNAESIAYLLRLVDALTVIASTLVVTATVDDEDIRHALEAMKDDPQELLTFVESVLAKSRPSGD
jgi:hypothetical protein